MNHRHSAAALAAFGLLVILAAVGLWLTRGKPAPAPQLEDRKLALEDRECACLLPGGDVLYVGGANGLYLLDAATFELKGQIEIPGGPALQLVSDLHKTPDGALWVAHNRGISVRRGNEWKTFGKEDGLLDLRANCFCPVEDGLWAGTWGGAYFFAETPGGDYTVQKKYTMENGLADNMVNAIHADGDGTLWFGAYYHSNTPCGLSILRDGQFSYLSVAQGLPHSFITSICALPDGAHYIGCGYLERGGLAVVRGQGEGFPVSRVYTENEGLPGPKVRSLFLDGERLWIATENDGILIVTNPKPNDLRLSGVYVKKENGLPDNEIKQIIEHDGYIYLAARRGVARLPAEAVARYCAGG